MSRQQDDESFLSREREDIERERLIREAYEGARSRLIRWFQLYTAVFGVIALILSTFGVTALVDSQVEEKIRERAELIQTTFAEVANSLTLEALNQMSRSRESLDGLTAAIAQSEERLAELEQGRERLRSEIARLEALLEEENASNLLAYLERDLFRLNSLSVEFGLCYADAATANRLANLNTALFLPTLFLDGVAETGFAYFDGSLDTIEMTTERQSVTVTGIGGLFCTTRRFVPFTPFQQALIGMDIRDLPAVRGIGFRTAFLPAQFEDASEPTDDLAREDMEHAKGIFARIEFNGTSEDMGLVLPEDVSLRIETRDDGFRSYRFEAGMPNMVNLRTILEEAVAR